MKVRHKKIKITMMKILKILKIKNKLLRILLIHFGVDMTKMRKDILLKRKGKNLLKPFLMII